MCLGIFGVIFYFFKVFSFPDLATLEAPALQQKKHFGQPRIPSVFDELLA
jgi:hypothetical protein